MSTSRSSCCLHERFQPQSSLKINHSLDRSSSFAAMSMSTILDSEATFVQRATEAGLTIPWVDALKAEALATFAKLSFAITTPGVPASDAQVQTFLGTLRPGVAATIADQSAFKRVLFEAQTLMIHNLKSSIKGDDATIQRMAPPEREARLQKLRLELKGIDISGPLEPAHSVYDLCTDMIEKNQILYLSPTKCLSRQQELIGAKPEKELQLDSTKDGTCGQGTVSLK